MCFAAGDADQRRLEGLFVRCTDWLFEGSVCLDVCVCVCACARSRSTLFSHQIVNGSGSVICVAVFSFSWSDRINGVINQEHFHKKCLV